MREGQEDEWIHSTDDGEFMPYYKENQRFNTKYLHISNIIIKFATKIIINFQIMLGILIFSAVLTYGTFILFHILGKVGDSINSMPSKSVKDLPKFTVEDMYSPNNSLSHFSKGDNYCSVYVSNKVIDKRDWIMADNITNLRNKVDRTLRNYAAIEKNKSKELVIL